MPPSEFIPLAEEMGLIVPLGEWVLREACKEAARWPDPIKVAVNLSPVQFRNRGLVTMVTHALAAARLAPHRLELEITEAVLLQDDEAIVTMLHQLRALGVRISMDDFGTGYSSLSYLRIVPVRQDQDRPLVHQGHRAQPRQRGRSSRRSRASAQSLGIETTAEGIETDEQLELVRRAGCTEMQGYLVSPPRPGLRGRPRSSRASAARLRRRSPPRACASERRGRSCAPPCAGTPGTGNPRSNPPAASAAGNPPPRTSMRRPCCRTSNAAPQRAQARRRGSAGAGRSIMRRLWAATARGKEPSCGADFGKNHLPHA